MGLLLTYVHAFWFSILASIAFASFFFRSMLWTLNGGDGKRYAVAILASLMSLIMLFAMVLESRLTPKSWLHWRAYLKEAIQETNLPAAPPSP